MSRDRNRRTLPPLATPEARLSRRLSDRCDVAVVHSQRWEGDGGHREGLGISLARHALAFSHGDILAFPLEQRGWTHLGSLSGLRSARLAR